MSIETFEEVAATFNMYKSLMNSEQQIKEGKVHEAREALKSVKEKYFGTRVRTPRCLET